LKILIIFSVNRSNPNKKIKGKNGGPSKVNEESSEGVVNIISKTLQGVAPP